MLSIVTSGLLSNAAAGAGKPKGAARPTPACSSFPPGPRHDLLGEWLREAGIALDGERPRSQGEIVVASLRAFADVFAAWALRFEPSAEALAEELRRGGTALTRIVAAVDEADIPGPNPSTN